jgi:flavin reductase (DIM6/NTAB) family NADH-FMN oxidoreductase RutF
MPSVSNPRQIVLVTCREEVPVLGKKQTKDNIITVAWHTPLSFEPMLYGIAIGKERFSNEIISKSGCFAVNFIPYHLEKEALFCGRHSGRHIDKFRETGLSKDECETIDCPKIGEALAWMECEVIGHHETGDLIFYVGKVNRIDMKEKGRRLYQIEGDKFTTTVR